MGAGTGPGALPKGARPWLGWAVGQAGSGGWDRPALPRQLRKISKISASEASLSIGPTWHLPRSCGAGAQAGQGPEEPRATSHREPAGL